MEENNEEGIVSIVYDSRFKPIPELSPLKRGLSGLEAELNSNFQGTVESDCIVNLKLSDTITNLRNALDGLFDSSGLPFKAKRPSLDPRAITEEQYREEKKKEERGYALLRELVEERGGEFSYFGPEGVSGVFSYILDA